MSHVGRSPPPERARSAAPDGHSFATRATLEPREGNVTYIPAATLFDNLELAVIALRKRDP
jgi:hypothetical protein